MLRLCPSCGRTNRIPDERLTDTARCGACKTSLPPPSDPIDADAALFDAAIAQPSVPVLVDFWAAWCGPCRMAAPEVAAVVMMINIGGCLTCDLDSYRASLGCVTCAKRTIGSFKGTDKVLKKQFEDARKEVSAFIKSNDIQLLKPSKNGNGQGKDGGHEK